MSQQISLGDAVISAATGVDGEVISAGANSQGAAQDFISGLGGKAGANVQVNFTYGAGGTTLKVCVDTSFDGGVTWVEVWRAAFTTASARKIINLSARTPKTTAHTPAALSDDAVVDGIFGDCWRARKIVEGTYSGNSSVAVRIQPHDS